jgi:hypothetical protein
MYASKKFYIESTAEELAEYFYTVTRQRISQLAQKYESIGGFEMVEKIKQAKRILKRRKKSDKPKKVLTNEQVLRKKARSLWNGIKSRCSNTVADVRKLPLRYQNVTISDEFKDFDKFFNWVIGQKGFGVKGFQIDKDILVKGNTVYSPATCCFVPNKINGLMIRCSRGRSGKRGGVPIGVSVASGKYHAQMMVDRVKVGLGYYNTVEEAFNAYKVAKEQNIKRMAELYKDQLDPRAYEALMNWTVEITD